MGDNRDDSLDSRDWGFVPRRTVNGRALLVYWSFEKDDPTGTRLGVDESGSMLRRIFDGAAAFYRGTRWERSGLLVR